jgi:hypothetical protein
VCLLHATTLYYSLSDDTAGAALTTARDAIADVVRDTRGWPTLPALKTVAYAQVLAMLTYYLACGGGDEDTITVGVKHALSTAEARASFLALTRGLFARENSSSVSTLIQQGQKSRSVLSHDATHQSAVQSADSVDREADADDAANAVRVCAAIADLIAGRAVSSGTSKTSTTSSSSAKSAKRVYRSIFVKPLEHAAAELLADETSSPDVFEGMCGVVEKAVAAGMCEQALEWAQKGIAMLLERERAVVAAAEAKDVYNVFRLKNRSVKTTSFASKTMQGSTTTTAKGHDNHRKQGSTTTTAKGYDDHRERDAWTQASLSDEQVPPVTHVPCAFTCVCLQHLHLFSDRGSDSDSGATRA